MHFAFLFVAVLVLSSCASESSSSSSPQEIVFPEGKTSTYSNDDSRFSYVNYWNEYYQFEEEDYILSFMEKGVLDKEKNKAGKNYEITVLSGQEQKLWGSSSLIADKLYAERDILIAYEDGEDREDTYVFYNISDGARILEYTNSHMTVSIPNSPDKRFFGFVSRNSASLSLDDELSLGTLSYASNKERLAKVYVSAKNAKLAKDITPYTPDMQFATENASNKIVESGRSLILWNADELYTEIDVSNFSVILTFYTEDAESYDVEIPIANDKVDFEKINYDKSIFVIK